MKDLSYLVLADIYGDALTQRQRDMLADYYERDYSLAEIADNYGVSRQAVHSAIKQAEESLRGYEEVLGIHEFVSGLYRRVADMKKNCADSESIDELEDFIRSRYGSVWQP